MPNFLGVDIATLLNQSMGPLVYDGTFNSIAAGARASGGTGPTYTSTPYACKGFAATYDQVYGNRQMTRQGDSVIVLIAASMDGVVPKPGDTIVLTGDPQLGAKTAVVAEKGVHRDPASATWTLEVKV